MVPAGVMDANRNHREMAIDCPSSFIGIKKESPRYPPPQQLSSPDSGSLKTEEVTRIKKYEVYF